MIEGFTGSPTLLTECSTRNVTFSSTSFRTAPFDGFAARPVGQTAVREVAILKPPVSKLSEIEGKLTDAMKGFPPLIEIRVPCTSATNAIRFLLALRMVLRFTPLWRCQRITPEKQKAAPTHRGGLCFVPSGRTRRRRR